MEAKDLVRLKAKLFSKAKSELELEVDDEVWFFCRQLHFIGRGVLKHVYPKNIGHGSETPLCSIRGRIMETEDRWEDFQGTIHQDDVCKTKEDAIKGLVKRLRKLYDKKQSEMLDLFFKKKNWRKKLCDGKK
jgi:hypothetical protein